MPPTLRVLNSDARELGTLEYIWIEGSGQSRSKTRIIPVGRDTNKDPVPVIDAWTASTPTGQVLLSPCHYLPDPIRGQASFIVLCEERTLQDVPTLLNRRARLRRILDQEGGRLFMWWGIRQPYTLMSPTGSVGLPTCQAIAERHLRICMDAGIMIHSARFDVTPLEFKIGYRRMPEEVDDPPRALIVADHLWIARHLLHRVATEFGTDVDYANRAPGSLFMSTAVMRDSEDAVTGMVRVLSGRTETTSRFKPRVSVTGRCISYIEDTGHPSGTDPYVSMAQLVEAMIGGNEA